MVTVELTASGTCDELTSFFSCLEQKWRESLMCDQSNGCPNETNCEDLDTMNTMGVQDDNQLGF